ncbi:MAG TPA: redoxin family protein [Pedobacter sp.]|jgi:thiol-disulfide isomerase/thioredoxin
MKKLKRNLLATCFSLTALSGFSQVRQEMRSSRLDTNMIVLDEEGKALRHYQYSKLMNSGEYTIHQKVGEANFSIKKLSLQEQIKYSELLEKLVATKSPMLKKGQTLNLSPFSNLLKMEEMDQKVKILIFWSSGCPPCTESFESINEVLRQVNNPDELLVLAITGDNQEMASRKLKEKPLLYAKLFSGASAIFKYYIFPHYQDNRVPIYVIADKNDVIRFSVDGIGPQVMNSFKTQLRAILNQ